MTTLRHWWLSAIKETALDRIRLPAPLRVRNSRALEFQRRVRRGIGQAKLDANIQRELHLGRKRRVEFDWNAASA
jgi:hypothetical protein